MLALSSLSFPNCVWPLEESIIHEEFYSDMCTSSLDPQLESCESFKFSGSNGGGGDATVTVIKKLSHNASERDRRKRLNSLYSSLRSLLPGADQTKKLSIPDTISRVLKYIPELQKEVERLQEKKRELTSRISSQEISSDEFKKIRRVETQSSIAAISGNRVGERQIVTQMCINKGNKVKFCDAISFLEEDGIVITDCYAFQTVEQMVFYTLHLRMEGTQVLEIDVVKEKLLSCFEDKDKLLALI